MQLYNKAREINRQKYVIFFSGGAMSGIFGAGVAEALQKINVYDKIEAVYGSSAGVLNGAYFLSHQSAVAASVYYENMQQDFINYARIPFGIFQRLWNRFILPIPPEHIFNPVDIDYLFKILTGPKRLDIETLKKQPIPLYCKLLNIATGDKTYYEVTSYSPSLVFKILKAAVSIVPYYLHPIRLRGKDYVDGGVAEPLGLDHIIKKHPNAKIILVINTRYQLSYYLVKIFEALMADLSLPNVPLFSSIISALKTVGKDMRRARRDKRVLLIKPPKNNPVLPHTTDPKKLHIAYRMGKAQKKKVKDFIDQ